MAKAHLKGEDQGAFVFSLNILVSGFFLLSEND